MVLERKTAGSHPSPTEPADSPRRKSSSELRGPRVPHNGPEEATDPAAMKKRRAGETIGSEEDVGRVWSKQGRRQAATEGNKSARAAGKDGTIPRHRQEGSLRDVDREADARGSAVSVQEAAIGDTGGGAIMLTAIGLTS